MIKTKMRYRTFVPIFLIAMSFILNGCSEMRDQFSSMLELQSKLSKKYDHKYISINIKNNEFLGVSFVNSRFNELNAYDMKVKAKEIALFTASTLDENSTIKNIAVSFTIHEKKFLIVSYTNSLNTFYFESAQLKKEHIEILSDKIVPAI